MDIYAVSDDNMDLYVSHHFPDRIWNIMHVDTVHTVSHKVHGFLFDVRACGRYGVRSVFQSVRTRRDSGQSDSVRDRADYGMVHKTKAS